MLTNKSDHDAASPSAIRKLILLFVQMPLSLLLFTGAVAGVAMLVLPWWCAVGEDDDTYIDGVVDDSYDSDSWYTDYSDEDDDDVGGDNKDGLTPDQLRRLPWFAYCGGGGRSCSICLEEMRDGERCRRPGRCRHAFHAACVDEWLTTRRTCPCCRELVLVPPAARLAAPTYR